MTNSPPMTGPIAGARAVGTTRMADARTRSACGNARNSMVRPTGVMRPPPIPCRIRNATISSRLPASPHRAEATVKIAMEPSSSWRGPMRSPSHAATGMDSATLTWYAMTVPATAVAGVWN